ncbi:MAG: hypothetical protein JRC90_10755 [Deltaproteobacteria bacterium]|nr:hypothetical protein [Deltaproteobacteria bacterium]
MEKLTESLKIYARPSRIVIHRDKYKGEVPGVITTVWIRGDQYLFSKEKGIKLGPLIETALDIIFDTTLPVPEGQTQLDAGLSAWQEYSERRKQKTLTEIAGKDLKNKAISNLFKENPENFKRCLPENDERCLHYQEWIDWADLLAKHSSLKITVADLQDYIRRV